MILATHAIVGAAAGRIFSNPLAAFIAAFISHIVIDTIPHWQYVQASFEPGENESEDDMVLDHRFIGDFLKFSVDCLLGAVFAIFVFGGEWTGFSGISVPLLAGIIGGILPDILEFVSFKIRREPLISLRKIHNVFHGKNIPALPYGILSQLAVIAVAVALSKFIH